MLLFIKIGHKYRMKNVFLVYKYKILTKLIFWLDFTKFCFLSTVILNK